MFFDTLKHGHVKDILLAQNARNVTKSYIYLGHTMPDNLSGKADIKAKAGYIYDSSNILFRKFYFCSERVKICYCPVIVVICICVRCGPTIESRLNSI